MKSILVCTNKRINPNQPSCGAKGGQSLQEKLKYEVEKAGIEINIKEIQCLGECESGPNLRFVPSGPLYHHVDENHLKEILKAAKIFSKS
jgi:(2Fe-2S) ferredoxin